MSNMDTTDFLTRRALRVADEAAAAADTIIVQPDSLFLRVGQTILPLNALRIEARDSLGRRVDRFAPMINIEDQSIAGMGSRGIVGRSPGRTLITLSVRRLAIPM